MGVFPTGVGEGEMSKKRRKKRAKALRIKRNKMRKILRQRKRKEGKRAKQRTTYSNSKCKEKTVEEENAKKQELIEEQLKIYKSLLPWLLERVSKIPDIRNPKKKKHRLAAIILFALFLFIYHLPSRRNGTKILTAPQFLENLKIYFPEIESMPHGDTVNDVLSVIDVENLQDELMGLIRNLLRKKKFVRYMVDKGYLVAVDGTVAYSTDNPTNDCCIEKEHTCKNGKKKTLYYVYVVEANLVFPNGLSIPLCSEFLDKEKGDDLREKQDCETNAFLRLIKRIKKEFPRLKITLLLDGLYATGPVMQQIQEYKWGYMITFKKGSIPTVWKEAMVLMEIEKENRKKNIWGDRDQTFRWINDIEYTFEGQKRPLILHVVACYEEWEEVDNKTGEIKKKNKTFVWISSKRITKGNVIKRCNYMARYRWSIEESILKEKKHGYNLEHCFSTNWNAMKGFHYLMRTAFLLNQLFEYSIKVFEQIKEYGIKEVMKRLRGRMKNNCVDSEEVQRILSMDRVHVKLI